MQANHRDHALSGRPVWKTQEKSIGIIWGFLAIQENDQFKMTFKITLSTDNITDCLKPEMKYQKVVLNSI